jgi:hypothetical protein
MSVNLYQTKQRHTPQDVSLHSDPRNNLNSEETHCISCEVGTEFLSEHWYLEALKTSEGQLLYLFSAERDISHFSAQAARYTNIVHPNMGSRDQTDGTDLCDEKVTSRSR